MNETTDAVLRAEQLVKKVNSPGGALTILHPTDMAVTAGESVAIVGPSGAGKSTLLALLAGLDDATSGEVWLDGAHISAMDEDGRAAVRARSVGFVFQSFHLIRSLTARENVMLPLELAHHGEAAQEAARTLERVGLQDRAEHYPRQLSGGEQQRVAIARAFVTRPRVLFADEPTGNLDQHTGDKVGDLLFNLHTDAEATLVMATHDRDMARRCDRILLMENGSLVEQQHDAVSA